MLHSSLSSGGVKRIGGDSFLWVFQSIPTDFTTDYGVRYWIVGLSLFPAH